MNLKRGKRGQSITLFVIIGIVVIVLAISLVYFWPKVSGLFMSKEQAAKVLASQVQPLRDAVSDCVGKVSEDIFVEIGKNAGYYKADLLPTVSFASTARVVVYKNINKERINKLPSLEEIERNYELALQEGGYEKIDGCLNNFKAFKRYFDVKPGTKNIKAEIYDDKVIIKVDWPITISKLTLQGKVSEVVEQNDVLLLIPLGNMWKVAKDICNCEASVGCDFSGVVWDEYIASHPSTLKYITIEKRSPFPDAYLYEIRSIPYRPKEKEFRFMFGVFD